MIKNKAQEKLSFIEYIAKNYPVKRTEIINHLIEKTNAKRYLEIGTSNGKNFRAIQAEAKVGVDPAKEAFSTYKMISDEFFEQNTGYFDVIFVDGLHHAKQVYKDILNALKILNKGGYIVCHDMNPRKEIFQKVPRVSRFWNGDCWKAWVKLRSERSDLEMYVVDTDHGCGVISHGKQNCINLKNKALNWQNLCKHKKEWLNLISIETFENNIF